MIVKKYVAETMSDALARIRKELGEDAVILKSRRVDRGGLFSFLSRQMVEVTAATPDQHPPPRRGPAFTPPAAPSPDGPSTPPVRSPYRTDIQGNATSVENKPARDTRMLSDMQDELSELRITVRELADHMKYKNAPSLPDKLRKRWEQLVGNGLGERLAQDLVQQLYAELKGRELEDDLLIDSRLREMVAKRFHSGPIPTVRSRGRPQVVALIGPTGVGKTTTLAKLATNRRIFGNRKVALVSTDTYRIAAVEQLQTFANIAGLPMEVVYRPEELDKAIRAHSDKEIVLIDTAGRSQNDSGALLELREFMDAAKPDEVLLVLSAGTRLADQRDVIRRFAQVPATRLVITKLDEIVSAGHLLDLASLIDRRWGYLTIGQNVPDDILVSDSALLARMVLKREVFQQLRRNGFRTGPKPG